MARDLFEEFGINPNQGADSGGRDLFEEAGIDPGQQQFNPLHSAGIGISTAGNEMAHGILQPLLERGAGPNPFQALEKYGIKQEAPFGGFREELKRASQATAKDRNALYEESKRQNPLSTMGGYAAGIALPTAWSALSTGGGSVAAKVPGFLKYFMPIVKGGLGGAASGASQYVNPGESRAQNTAVGGAIGTGLGILGPLAYGAFKGGKNAYKYLSHVPEALQPEKAAGNIVKAGKKVKDISREGYEGLHEAVEQSSLQKINLPDIDQAIIAKNAKPEQLGDIKSFFENPNIDSAGKAIDVLDDIIKTAKTKSSESLIHIPEHIKLKDRAVSPIEDLTHFKKQIEKTLKPYKADISLKSLQGTENSSAAPDTTLTLLKQYLKAPTFRNAHDSYKDLGKLIRNLKDKESKSGLLSAERNLRNNAMKARSKLKSQMFKNFEKEEVAGFADEFSRLNQYHRQEVRPYEHRLIEEYLEGGSTAGDFLKGLGGEKLARKQLMPRHPAIGVRKGLPYVLGAAGIYGVPKGASYLFGGKD